MKNISIIILALLTLTYSTSVEKFSSGSEISLEKNKYLAKYNVIKLGNDIDSADFAIGNETISKTFEENDSVYELTSYLEIRDNEVFLIMKIQEENNLMDYCIFEGDYQKLLHFDPNWKIFNENTSIFNKLLKKVIPDKNFSIDMDSSVSYIIIQFAVNILDEAYFLKLKLTKQTNQPVDPGHWWDLKTLALEVSNLKLQLENLEKVNQLLGRAQNLVVEIPAQENFVVDGYRRSFELNVVRTGEIEFRIELDFKNMLNNYSWNIKSAIDMQINTKNENIPLFNTFASMEADGSYIRNPRIITINKSRNYYLVKGKYTGTFRIDVIIQAGNPTPLNAMSMILRAIQH